MPVYKAPFYQFHKMEMFQVKSRVFQKWAGIGVLVAIVLVLFVFADVRSLLRGALRWVERTGLWGQISFVIIYAIATVLFIPGSVLTLGAGGVFGLVRGAILVSLGSTLGATGAFLVGRYLARDWVSKKIEGNATFSAIDRSVAEQGWKIVGLTRLSPVFPFTLLNYAFGLTNVSLHEYVVASWIGMMPGTVMYVYLGTLIQAGGDGQRRSPGQWALYGLGLIATLAVTVMITRISRRALAKRTTISA